MVSTRTGAGDAGQRVAIDPNDPAYSTSRSGANVRGGAARETQTQDPAFSTPGSSATPRARFTLPPPPGVGQPSTGGAQPPSTGGDNTGGGDGAGSNSSEGGSTPNQGGPQGGDASQRNISHRGARGRLRSLREINEKRALITPSEIDLDPGSKTHRMQRSLVQNGDLFSKTRLEILHLETGSFRGNAQARTIEYLVQNAIGLEVLQRHMTNCGYPEAYLIQSLQGSKRQLLLAQTPGEVDACFNQQTSLNLLEAPVSEDDATAASLALNLSGSDQHVFLDKWLYELTLDSCCKPELRSELLKRMEKLPEEERGLTSLLYNLKYLTMMANKRVVKAMERSVETFLEETGIRSVSGEDMKAYGDAIVKIGASISGLGGDISGFPQAFLRGLRLSTSHSDFKSAMEQAATEADSNSYALVISATKENVYALDDLGKLKTISEFATDKYQRLAFQGKWHPTEPDSQQACIFAAAFNKSGSDGGACHPNCREGPCKSRQECNQKYRARLANKENASDNDEQEARVVEKDSPPVPVAPPALEIKTDTPPVPSPSPPAKSPTITLSASMVCQRIDDIERTSTSTDPNVAVLLPTLRTILGLK